MKNRTEQARYEKYKIENSLDALEKLIMHMDNYETIIKRFINKRDALRLIVKNPYGAILQTKPEELEKYIIEYNLLEELLKGVY